MLTLCHRAEHLLLPAEPSAAIPPLRPPRGNPLLRKLRHQLGIPPLPGHDGQQNRQEPCPRRALHRAPARPPPRAVARHGDKLRLRVELQQLGDEAVRGRVGDGDEAGRRLAEEGEEAVPVLPGGEDAGPEFYVGFLSLLVP